MRRVREAHGRDGVMHVPFSTRYFQGLAERRTYERDDARRWSAAWKKAAKKFFGMAIFYIYEFQENQRDVAEARAVARRLLRERDEARVNVPRMREEIGRLSVIVDQLRAKYDAKYAEWSSLQAECSRRGAEIAELKEVLEQVEWHPREGYCLWCLSFIEHAPDCPRQKALGKG